MDKFRLEAPTAERQNDAIDYINEFYAYDSHINGSGGLNRYLNDYIGWLIKLEKSAKAAVTEEQVPARTFFLVRSSDSRIVGMINIRLALNDNLKKYGGNIGYSIRPTERGKGYNKINLYMALKVCQNHGIKKVLLDADSDNPASWRTMEALGGVKIREYFESEHDLCMVRDYEIDVDKSIAEHSDQYEHLVERIDD